MPEIVEVKIMIDDLKKEFKNTTLENLDIVGGRYVRHGKPENYKKFIDNLPAKIIDFNTHGKFIWITLDNGSYILITLGMSGHFLPEKDKHSHYVFETNKGDFYLDDVRNFATMKFTFDKKELDKKLKKLGPDPLNEKITDKQFIDRIRKINQNKTIAEVLLDQEKALAGIGNYLRSDILYKAKISPHRKLKNLNDDDLKELLKAIKYIVDRSYEIQSKSGIHTYPFIVYKRKETAKGEKVKREEYKGRALWWVPEIQK